VAIKHAGQLNSLFAGNDCDLPSRGETSTESYESTWEALAALIETAVPHFYPMRSRFRRLDSRTRIGNAIAVVTSRPNRFLVSRRYSKAVTVTH
jgi:hypothetical protein